MLGQKSVTAGILVARWRQSVGVEDVGAVVLCEEVGCRVGRKLS
jgi:hypothetical protein